IIYLITNPKFKMSTLFSTLPPLLRRHKIVKALSRLFPQYAQHTFKCDDFIISANLSDAATRQAYRTQHFEDYGYFNLFEKLLPPNGILLDIGANYGFHTFGLLNRCPNIECHLFEPNEACVSSLHHARALYPKVKINI
ncbi:MAG: hypothetical protein CUN55_19400, partial [Phototrophicales bacterium]